MATGISQAAYLPRFLPAWASETRGLAHREADASLAMFDISGFTRLTERLSSRGRAGAEELSDILHEVFTPIVTAAESEGADLLKWGGDAVLLLIEGPDHPARAARAAIRMQRALDDVGHLTTSVGRVYLRASTGVQTGPVHLVLAGDAAAHRELVVLGPTASMVARLDQAAAAGQVVVGDATADRLKASLVGRQIGPGHLLTSLPRLGAAAGTGGADVDPVASSEPDAEVVATLLPPQLRTHLAQHAHEPEHRVVTAAFVRFDGTDRMLADRGLDRMAEAVDELVHNVQDSCARHGVAFHESDIDVDGGKFMLVAGAPLSAGDDADHLLSAVRLIVDRVGEISLRAGVAQGRVFTGDLGPPTRRTYSVKGGAVNLAARLAARAEPQTAIVTADLLDHARNSYEVQPLPPLPLKGVARPVRAAVLGQVGDVVDEVAATLMVGRDAELDLLTSALDRLGSGRGSVIEVVGEPGIGKTRLLSEMLASSEDFRVVTASGDRTGAFVPYGTIRQLLAGVLGIAGIRDHAVAAAKVSTHVDAVAPELSGRLALLGAVLSLELGVTAGVADLEEEFRVQALHRLVLDLLTATLRAPTLMVIEDTQLLDPASAGLLTRIAAEASARPWLLVTTRRAGAEGWSPAEAQQIFLEPLAHTASVVLAEVVTPERPLPPAVVETLALRAGGHPLFLRELVLAAARGDRLDDLPESVEELVAVQLDALPPAQRALLRRAAVLGSTFSVRLLRQMLGDPEGRSPTARDLRALLEGLDGFLVATGQGSMGFRHAVHREVAYAGLAFRTRRTLHGYAADVLARSAGTVQERPELLALHNFAGGRYEQAWVYARRAGHKANERFAPAAAVEAFSRAVEAAQRSRTVSRADRARDLESLGDALFLSGRSAEAADAYREADRAGTDEPTGSAALALKRAKVAQRQGRHSQALRWITKGLNAIKELRNQEAAACRARLLARRAVISMSQGRYDRARQAADDAVTTATAAGELDALAQAHLVLHGVHVFSGTADAEEHGVVALRLYEELGDLSGQAHALNNLAMRRLLEGRWPEALGMFGRAAEVFTRVGDAADAANASYNQADLLNRQGHHGEARALLDDVLRVAQAVQDEELVALVLREQGRALSRAGSEEGLLLLGRARDIFVTLGEKHEICDTDIALAEAQLLAGRPGEALALVRAAIEDARALAAATLLPAGYRVEATACIELGDVESARSALARGLALSSAPEVAHERGFLMAVAARADRVGSANASTANASGTTAATEATAALARLGVVRLPLPW